MNLNILVTEEKNVRFVFPSCLACIITKLLRSVRLMWLPFLIGPPTFKWYMANLVVKNEHQKRHMSRWECWIICLEYRYCSVKYNGKYNQEGSCDRLKSRKKIFTLTFYNFCIAILILELELEIFVICNCRLDETIPLPIQQLKLSIELEVPTIRDTYLIMNCQVT